MKIGITGSGGFVGSQVVARFRNAGHAMHPISTRSAPRAEDVDGCEAVIHLAGEPVAQRWSTAVRERIRSSRVEGTRGLVNALGEVAHPPSTLISASAVGYYGSRGDELLTESSAPAQDFLSTVAVEWEREAQAAQRLGVRVVLLRIAMVLGGKGGALGRMLLPFRLGLGGPIAGGRHWMSWIHVEDLVSLISFALTAPALVGAINASSPNPVTNVEFTRELARAVHRPAIFPIPRVALKVLFGEMAEIVYGSQRVVPEAVLRAGFQFQFPRIDAALSDLLDVSVKCV